MRALAAGILLALAVTGCGNSRGSSSASPGAASASPCVVSATPSIPPRSPSPPSYGGTISLSQGQTVQRPFTVSPSLLEVAVQSSWSAGDVRLTLISPSGRHVDRTTDAPDVLHPNSLTSETLVVKTPEAGNWMFELFGASVPAAGEQVAVGVTEIPQSDFAPIAYVGLSTDRGVAPLTIQFTENSSGFQGATIASYLWNFGDCSPADSVQNPTHTFITAGTFDVSVTVTDSNGQSDTADHKIVVTAFNHAPTADFLWGVLDTSKPHMVSLDGETSKDIDGQITTYSWDFGDGSNGNGKLVAHNYSKSGTYTVKLTVTDDGGLTGSTCQLVKTGVSLGAPAPCA
jgi:PKD repeat protein